MFPLSGKKPCGPANKNKLLLPALITSLAIFPIAGHTSALSKTYDAFTSKSKISVSLVNYFKTTEKYFKDKDKGIAETDRQYEWAQSAGLFYSTGKIRVPKTPVRAGLNLGYGYVFELDTSYPGNEHYWNGGEKILQSENCYWTGKKEPKTGSYKCKDSSGYGKLPVANIQFSWKKGGMWVGDGFYTAGLISTADENDALLSSYRGVMVRQKYQDYTFRGAFVTGFMGGNESEMGDLEGKTNYYDIEPSITYDYLYTADVKRKIGDDAGFQVAYGEAKDYLRRYMTNAWVRVPLAAQTNIHLHGQYYYNHSAGELWDIDREQEKVNFDQYASNIGYMVTFEHDAMKLIYGYMKTNAPLESDTKLGSFSYGFGNAKGYFKAPVGGGYGSFRRDGQEAMSVAAVYDFRNFDLPGLDIRYIYNWSDSPAKSKLTGEINNGKEYEHVIKVNYEPKSGMFEGWYVNYKQAFYRPDATVASLSEEDPQNKADKTTIKLILGYNFSI